MSRVPTRTTLPEIAEACNPTGVMKEKWRAPSNTQAPYPPNLPNSERTTWDMKSEAEVQLDVTVKEMTLGPVFSTDGLSEFGNWSAWWQRGDHAQTLQD